MVASLVGAPLSPCPIELARLDGEPGLNVALLSHEGGHWGTVGVSHNIIDASFQALHDSIIYKLLRAGAKI